MELSDKEFRAMNHPLRRMIQRRYELPIMRKLGLEPAGRDILEIGCGSGYGAQLLAQPAPLSYTGIDLMPEQIALARQRGLVNCTFLQGDVADLSAFPDGSFDLVVDFGILHHVPAWRKTLAECKRVLRQDGLLLVEEPDGAFLSRFDRIFHWGHPEEAAFSESVFEDELVARRFAIEKSRRAFGFFWVSARKDANARA
ncbi:MAG TPA: class I SAM-dependent methyltransferase [Anaerolineales bacterium]|nr:class I SAM-dependent methyltransferase [Anaerolineales bacterium]